VRMHTDLGLLADAEPLQVLHLSSEAVPCWVLLYLLPCSSRALSEA